MIKCLLLSLMLCLGAVCVQQAVAAPKILVWGDSLSATHGIERQQGWVALLAQRLHAEGYDYVVVNGSISGETTSGGLKRLPKALRRHRPAVVILELGANDGLRESSLQKMQDNLQQMIAISEQSGAKVLLVGMLLPPSLDPQFTAEFDGIYKALARRDALPLVPFLLQGVADRPELMQEDGLHPLAAAEPRVLDNVWPQLSPLLHRAVR